MLSEGDHPGLLDYNAGRKVREGRALPIASAGGYQRRGGQGREADSLPYRGSRFHSMSPPAAYAIRSDNTFYHLREARLATAWIQRLQGPGASVNALVDERVITVRSQDHPTACTILLDSSAVLYWT